MKIDRVFQEVESSIPLSEEQKEKLGEVKKRLAQTERATTDVLTWEDDPASPEQPVRVAMPELDTPPLAIKIAGDPPEPGIYGDTNTPEFRYWSAAAALRRGAEYWSRIVDNQIQWWSGIGQTLPVTLDAGEELNAFYDRKGLLFFHATVHGKDIYSGESPDVLCHELGHAVLDALSPQLYDTASDEVASFHESFGDISSLLCALQLPTFRNSVLTETDRDVRRSSRLSRLAEQLGWAIQQGRPDGVYPESGCLRNAVNSFFYQDPVTLPPRGPACAISSEPHSFSRVFTGAFYDAFARMVAVDSASPNENTLVQVSEKIGKLLVQAVKVSPVVPDYYSQVAAHMIATDTGGKYRAALASAFVRHGILSLEATSSLVALGVQATEAAVPRREASEMLLPLQGATYSLRVRTLLVQAPLESKRLPVTAGTPEPGMIAMPSGEKVAKAFVDDLFRRGRVEVGEHADSGSLIVGDPMKRKTHRLEPTEKGLVLKRILFE